MLFEAGQAARFKRVVPEGELRRPVEHVPEYLLGRGEFLEGRRDLGSHGWGIHLRGVIGEEGVGVHRPGLPAGRGAQGQAGQRLAVDRLGAVGPARGQYAQRLELPAGGGQAVDVAKERW